MKRKLDIGILVTSVAFAAAASAVIVALVCMAADIHIWHKLMPASLAAAAVTGLAFVVSLVLHFYNAKSMRTEPLPDTEAAATEPTAKEKRKARVSKGFKIAALACFLCAVAFTVAARFCSGLTELLMMLFSSAAALVAGASAVVAVVLGRRSAAEKTALVGLISVPFLLFALFALLMLVFFGAMFYIMIVSWAQWGML